MIKRISVDKEHSLLDSYNELRKRLKHVAEYDFSNPRIMDAHASDLMHLLLKAYRDEMTESKLYGSYFTDLQYLLMFQRRRNEIAREICSGDGGRECVIRAFRTLVKAAYIRSELLRR